MVKTDQYCGDYYGWLEQTAKAIEEGRFSEIDRAQIAEELRDMGKAERRAIESYMERIMVHLLKIEHQPGKHTRSWDLSIATSRVRLKKLFSESPSLATQAEELMIEAYETARLEAARQTGLRLETFPEQCPFGIGTIVVFGPEK